MVFYVYLLFRPNGAPCYVGKGKGGRLRSHFRNTHNKHLQRIIKNAGGSLPVVVLREGLEEQEAFLIEKALILAIGRGVDGPLVNETDGGEGISGYRHTEEANERNRQKHLTENLSEETRRKMSKSQKGKVVSTETRIKLSKVHKGKPRPQHVIDAVVKAHTGVKRSPETCEKIRQKAIGRIASPETKEKMRIAHLYHNANNKIADWVCLPVT